MTVGLAPENVDPALHVIGSIGFIFSGVGLILFGRGIGRDGRWVANLSLGLGILALIGSILLFPLLAINYGGGAAERLADYPMFVWFAVLGTSFLRRASTTRRPSL